MKRLRLGMVIISEGIAGAENVIHCLAGDLSKMDIQVHLLLNDEISNYFSDLPDVSVHKLGRYAHQNSFIGDRLKHFNLGFGRRLKKVCQEGNFDIIQFHMESALVIFDSYCKDVNTPFVVTLHGSDIANFHNNRSITYAMLSKPHMASMLSRAKGITSVSHWQIESAAKYIRQKTVVIPNGVDTTIFRPLNTAKADNIILFVGRFIHLKGIDALVAVARTLPQYRFMFAGSGPLGELMNLPNTLNLGQKSKDELAYLYNKATVCAFPSRTEGFSCVGLEAMSCGKLIIATKKGFTEYVENGTDGLLIDHDDPNELRNAIVKAMSDSALRKRLGYNARQKALAFDWKQIAHRYAEYFHSCLLSNPQIPAESEIHRRV